MPRCIDLFSGTRSATKYFAEAGWEMDYVEIAEGCDVRGYHATKADVVVACPPCVDYSLLNRKYAKKADRYLADPALWNESLRVVREARPTYWYLENVKGAQQVWGRAPYHYGPYFLWGYFPMDLPSIAWSTSLKGTHAYRDVITSKNGGLLQSDDGKSAAQKAMWPDALAKAVYGSCDKALR